MRGFLLSLAFSSLAVAHSFAQDFTSRDWSLGCNDQDYCIARADGTDGMELKIERPVDAGAPLFVSVRIDPDTPLAEGMQVEIEVLGQAGADSKTIDRIYTGNEMTFGGAPDRALIHALRLGNKAQVTVRFGGDIGTRIYDVPLAGVTSVLAEMDRAQRRDDRDDAIVLIGGTPSGVSVASETTAVSAPEPEPAPPPPPVSAPEAANFGPAKYADILYAEADLPEAVLMTGYRVFDCDFPFVLDAYGAQVYGVTDSLELWMVPCNPADVNVDFYISLHTDGDTEFYEFKENPTSGTMVGLVTNPRWDNEKRQLSVWSVYSPDSDCGSFATYQYVTEDDAFDLIAFREKNNCDGAPTIPEDYPLTWSAN
ncbi:MAG: DUF1176 domain-containing protein [Ahrensia sp.]